MNAREFHRGNTRYVLEYLTSVRIENGKTMKFLDISIVVRLRRDSS